MHREKVPVLYITNDSPTHDFVACLGSWVCPRVTPWSEVAERGLPSGDTRIILAHLDSPDVGENARRMECLERCSPHLPRVVVMRDGGQAWTQGESSLPTVELQPGESMADFALRVAAALELARFRSRAVRGGDTLELMMDHSQIPMGIYNRTGHLVHCNDAFVTLFGARQPFDVSVFDLPHHCTPKMQAFHECLRQGRSASYDAGWMNPHDQHPLASDKRLYLSVVAIPLMVEGRMEYLVTTFHDLTARLEAEEALREANQSLQAAHAQLEQRVSERTLELERVKNELARKNRELEDFSYRVGHDLKNGLFVIRTFLDMVERSPQEACVIAPTARETSDRLIDFVQRLLMMARAGRVIGSRSPTDLGEVVRRVFDELRVTRREAELVVTPPIPTVHVDPSAMEQVLRCLLENCFQHGDPDRRPLVEFSATTCEGQVEFRLRDHGRGVTRESLESIFMPLFSEAGHGHLGFGLQIVKKIVEGHGGRIHAESAGPGQGLEMVFEIPAG